MYGMVLMAALSTGAASPEWGWGDGCYGGNGGCYGGNGGGGGYYYAGYGSCFGGGLNGIYGCVGGGYGNYGCYGCHGAHYVHYYTYSCYGCYGCHGCYGCYGCYGCTGYQPIVGQGGPPDTDGRGRDGRTDEDTSTRARLVVKVPADAKLYIDGKLMKTTSAKRTFRTPALQKGQTYYYVLRTEVVREGQAVSETKRVLVRPGRTVWTTFKDPADGLISRKKRTR
jgi:uncharacterized protein (TIGR03000 family)